MDFLFIIITLLDLICLMQNVVLAAATSFFSMKSFKRKPALTKTGFVKGKLLLNKPKRSEWPFLNAAGADICVGAKGRKP